MYARSITLALLVAITVCALPVAAQEAAPADGILIQVRTPVTTLGSLIELSAAAPQFNVGLRRGRAAFGLGFGLTRAAYSDDYSAPGYDRESTTTATAWQIGLTGWFDFWRSADQATVGNVVAAVRYGRATFRREFVENFGGTIYESSDRGSGNLYGLVLGVGGDRFFGPNFSLGLEAGAQGTFATDLEMEDANGQDVGVTSAILYGAMRATVCF